jgi:hypothetical protein
LNTGTKTSSIHTGAKIAQAANFMRSATAPEIRAGVMTANMPRKTMVSRPAPPSSPVMLIPSRKARSKLPMIWLLSTEASEKPTTTQRIGMINRHQKFIISMLSTLRLRSIPP